MDRFIASGRILKIFSLLNLKSNMDRFIAFGVYIKYYNTII